MTWLDHLNALEFVLVWLAIVGAFLGVYRLVASPLHRWWPRAKAVPQQPLSTMARVLRDDRRPLSQRVEADLRERARTPKDAA